MIRNQEDAEVAKKIQAESDANPIVSAIVAAAESSEAQFALDLKAPGFEILAAPTAPDAPPSRARLRVFSPRTGHTLIFFYKKSLVPYSRDRFSYGGVELSSPTASPGEIQDWLAFLSSGFHPERRPSRLLRAFPYEIPE
jgi:hypothetical protein